MANFGVAGPTQPPVVDPWAMPLPGETFDQYRLRLWRQQQADYDQQQQDARTRMQMQANATQQQQGMRSDAAYQASQRAMQGSRNQMTLTDLAYNAAQDRDRDRQTRIGSVSQSYRNAGLGQY
jgi:hypothetical protein